MAIMTFFNLKFILPFLVLCQYASTADDIKDDSDRGASDRGTLWFGPRLGKRSLRESNEDNRQTFLKLLEAADALKYYYDQLPYYEALSDDPETRVTKKVVFTPKLGRSLNSAYQERRRFENVEFTPRLGRRLTEDLAVTQPDQEIYKPDPDQIDRRTKFFSPRLGRNVNFSPRLGREIAYGVTFLMLKCTQSYVLLAANLDDFKKLAKKFVPEKLAIQIAEMAATSAANFRQDTPPRSRDEGQYEKDIEQDVSDVSAKANSQKYTLPHKSEGMKLNFEDLVQKVKERIEEDMVNQKLLLSTPGHEQRGPDTYSVADKNVDDKHEDDLPDVRNSNQHADAQPHSDDKNKREWKIEQLDTDRLKESNQDDNVDAKTVEEEPVDADEAEVNVDNQHTFVVQPPSRYAKVKQTKEKLHNTEQTTPDKNDEYEDEPIASKPHDQQPDFSPPQEDKDVDLPYSKVSMIKNDSYEDYVTPVRETNIYASRESKTLKKERAVVTTKKNTETTKMKLVAFVAENGYDDYKNKDYDDNVEELKAKTEDLQYDDSVYTEAQQHETKKKKLTTPMSKVKVKYVIGTNIPKRDIAYKMSSPNYYAKIPVVAEKYDFNEPIPEKDREPENLKPIPAMPSAINGKVKLYK